MIRGWRIRQLVGASRMLVVEIEKPENQPLSTWFSTLRDWLDRNRCAPSAFARAGRRLDRPIYRISFDNAAQAHAFCAAFADYRPTIRRATSLERDQSRASAEPPPAAHISESVAG